MIEIIKGLILGAIIYYFIATAFVVSIRNEIDNLSKKETEYFIKGSRTIALLVSLVIIFIYL